MGDTNQKLADYCQSGRKKVNGWFSQNDAEIMLALLKLQGKMGVGGAVAEIGVHHGKSFIAMALSLRDGEKGMCIDIFDDQSLNLDKSGLGDRAIFEANMAKFGVDQSKVVIHTGSSLDLKPEQITAAVGAPRFFSVDGGHWREVVVNDLELASAVLNEGGIIAMDDFLSPAWPDVSYAFFDWHRTPSGEDFAPIAIGPTKLFLARKGKAQEYLDGLLADEEIRSRTYKMYDFMGMKIPLLVGKYPAFLVAARNKLVEANPALYEQLLKVKRRIIS